MFYRNEVVNDYFYWLVDIISNGEEQSYTRLLKQLFDTPFIPTLDRDLNRVHDGLDLRDRYSYETGIDFDISDQCTVLEMMIALSIRCENDVMYNPALGDRTYIWFWLMIRNLGLTNMTDNRFNSRLVESTLKRLIDRTYGPDGEGGLFYVPGVYDMRDKEIWYQMNTFLGSLMG